MSEFRICGLVPTFDNPRTIRGVVERIRAHMADVIVVDDGSSGPGREAVEALVGELPRLLARKDVQDPDPARQSGRVEPAREGLPQLGLRDAVRGHCRPDLLAAGATRGADHRCGIPDAGNPEQALLDLSEGNANAGHLRDAIPPSEEGEAASGGQRDQVRPEV